MTFEFNSLKLVLRRYTHSKKHLQVEQVPLRFILSRDISNLGGLDLSRRGLDRDS